MDLTDFVKQQIKGARSLLNSAIENTPQELVNQRPNEICNTIAAAYAHVVGGEDYFIQSALQEKPRLWESAGWGQQLGISTQLGPDWWSLAIPDFAAFREYANAVHAATDAYLETLGPQDFDRIVKVFGNERPAARVFSLIATHTAGHAGEIATLKAALGVKGLPF